MVAHISQSRMVRLEIMARSRSIGRSEFQTQDHSANYSRTKRGVHYFGDER